MKIAQITNHFWPCIGGIEQVVETLSKELIKKHEVTIICLNKCAKQNACISIKENYQGLAIRRLTFINLKNYFPAFGILSEIKPYDLLHIHGLSFFSDFLLFTRFIHKKPIILNTHGGIFHTNPKKWHKRIYFFGLQKFLLKKASLIIADSENDFKIFSQIVPESKIKIIPNPVDIEKFQTRKQEKQPNTFLFVGRFSKNKRIDLLIQTFAEMQKQIKNAQLWIVGKDFDGIKTSLVQQIRKFNLGTSVQILENINDSQLVEIYTKAEFFMSASEYEGFGVSVIEGMAAGCIPILNKISAFEDILENGKNGLLVDFTQKNSSQVIAEFTKQNHAQFKVKERSADYSIQKEIKKLNEIYAQAVL
ncbi:MAG: glycosyltransferase family 4 protein [Candidatus Diapherotrites archaeon]|nr:glycosyltransferase family 4 protein [Candidatus Diapherotrites archaeon]